MAASFLVLAGTSVQARKPATGWLEVDSLVKGARVYVDGKPVGRTPLEKPVRLAAGKHRLKVTKMGFSPFKSTFIIRPRRKTTIEVQLLPLSGLVKVTSNVEGAEVYIDNRLAGKTPLVKEVLVGKHEILVVREGYNDYETRLAVIPGKRHFIEANLTPFREYTPEARQLLEKKKIEQQLVDKLAKEAAAKAEMEARKGAERPAAVPWYKDFYRKWWFWTAVGAVAAVAVAVPVAMTVRGTQANLDAHHGDTIRLPLVGR